MIGKMNLKNKNLHISVIGLGYVGFPLAVELGKIYKVVGYDIDKERILNLRKGHDVTNELSKIEISKSKNLDLQFTSESIASSNVYIITVPTPVDSANTPDLTPLKQASKTVGKFLKKRDVVIYESTVFPGCTEEVCVPILEKFSNLKFNKDFFCGYSPERINPGDSVHSLKSVIKVTSGSNEQTAKFVDDLYASIIDIGTYKASSIIVAEAAKVIENTQRDVNIALMNELAILFDKIGIDTAEVLNTAATKWNFLPFMPGLVGGHCIGVDPYYLTHKAAKVGHHPEIILAGRKINDNMANFIAEKTISEVTKNGINPINSKIAILGITFKEDCPDMRNTKVISLIDSLKKYHCEIIISDDFADEDYLMTNHNLYLSSLKDVQNQDAIVLAVGHNYLATFSKKDFERMIKPNGVLIDVKSLYDKSFFKENKITHWRL